MILLAFNESKTERIFKLQGWGQLRYPLEEIHWMDFKTWEFLRPPAWHRRKAQIPITNREFYSRLKPFVLSRVNSILAIPWNEIHDFELPQ